MSTNCLLPWKIMWGLDRVWVLNQCVQMGKLTVKGNPKLQQDTKSNESLHERLLWLTSFIYTHSEKMFILSFYSTLLCNPLNMHSLGSFNFFLPECRYLVCAFHQVHKSDKTIWIKMWLLQSGFPTAWKIMENLENEKSIFQT